MTKPLCLPGMGDFVAVRAKGVAPRMATRFWAMTEPGQREKFRREVFVATTAVANDRSNAADNPHTVLFTQKLIHPRLQWATRQLEVWKGEPRAKIHDKAEQDFFRGTRDVLYRLSVSMRIDSCRKHLAATCPSYRYAIRCRAPAAITTESTDGFIMRRQQAIGSG